MVFEVPLVFLVQVGSALLLFLASPSYGQLFPEVAALVSAPQLREGVPEPKRAHSQWKICQNNEDPDKVLTLGATFLSRRNLLMLVWCVTAFKTQFFLTHLIVTVTSSILSVMMTPVMWCLTAVRVKMLGADLKTGGKHHI